MRERASTSRPSCSSYIASSPPMCSIQDHRAGVQGTAQPLACVPGRKLPTCVCHWTPTAVLVGHRHMPSAANQHTFWRSLIRCCWTSSMEQSANPAARVRNYTRTVSTSTYLVMTAAVQSDNVFCVLCISSLTYLLNRNAHLCASIIHLTVASVLMQTVV